jgi:hypothetical protein
LPPLVKPVFFPDYRLQKNHLGIRVTEKDEKTEKKLHFVVRMKLPGRQVIRYRKNAQFRGIE